MSSLQQNASFLTFSGELTASGAVRLLSVLLQAPGHRLTLEANGGGDWLREDLAELGEELLRAAQRRPVRRDWFLYDLPGLRLEDFQPDGDSKTHPQSPCVSRAAAFSSWWPNRARRAQCQLWKMLFCHCATFRPISMRWEIGQCLSLMHRLPK